MTNLANEEMISKLEDEINQLRGVKSTYLPTDFFLVNNCCKIAKLIKVIHFFF